MRKSKAFKKKIMRIVSAIFIFFSVPSYADFSDNLRVSLDGSARLNNNIAENNTSRIYALGLDTHKVFSSANGDIGYAVGQLYLTKLSNQTPYSSLFNSPDDKQFVIREAHLNYTAGPQWLPNIRVGHFTLPFGVEASIDTNGRLLDYNHGKNLGTKLDWGLGFNKVLTHVEYEFSYTLGGKNELVSADDGTRYSELHKKYHPHLNQYLTSFGFYDIFLVEPETGVVVYSVFKELDFATSLLTGPYKETGLAEAFRLANASTQKNDTFLVDFKPYFPSYEAAAAFISSPQYWWFLKK